MNYISKKKIVIDMFLNIVATAIPTFSLQLLVMPLIASFIMGEDYGLLLTIISVLNVIPSTMGNALNNIRLIYGENSVDDGKTEDFNVILLVMTVINCAVVGFFFMVL